MRNNKVCFEVDKMGEILPDLEEVCDTNSEFQSIIVLDTAKIINIIKILMKTPRIYVDFNEMIESDLVLLSQSDYKNDSDGNLVYLYNGLYIYIYMDDLDEHGNPDNLIAEGFVETNKIKSGWGSIAKWCCRINQQGILHESDL